MTLSSHKVFSLNNYKSWQRPIFAFFSTQFYRELGANGKGVGVVYLLALLSISCAVIPIKEFSRFYSMLHGHGQEIIEQIPELTIEKGKLSTNQGSPYYVSDPESGTHLILFSTDEQELDLQQADAAIVVSADKLMMPSSGGEIPFKDINHFHLTAKEIFRWLNICSYTVPVFVYVISLACAWLGHIAQALGFSLAGLLLAKTIGVQLKYEGILRVTCVALGNVILLDGIMNIFPLDIPGVGLLYPQIAGWGFYKFFLALGYTLFAVGANLSPPGFRSVSDTGTESPHS